MQSVQEYNLFLFYSNYPVYLQVPRSRDSVDNSPDKATLLDQSTRNLRLTMMSWNLKVSHNSNKENNNNIIRIYKMHLALKLHTPQRLSRYFSVMS